MNGNDIDISPQSTAFVFNLHRGSARVRPDDEVKRKKETPPAALLCG